MVRNPLKNIYSSRCMNIFEQKKRKISAEIIILLAAVVVSTTAALIIIMMAGVIIIKMAAVMSIIWSLRGALNAESPNKLEYKKYPKSYLDATEVFLLLDFAHTLH